MNVCHRMHGKQCYYANFQQSCKKKEEIPGGAQERKGVLWVWGAKLQKLYAFGTIKWNNKNFKKI